MSAYSYEDLNSDYLGAYFAYNVFDPSSELTLVEQIVNYLESLGATTPESAPNWDQVPESDSHNPPIARNYTAIPMYIQ